MPAQPTAKRASILRHYVGCAILTIWRGISLEPCSKVKSGVRVLLEFPMSEPLHDYELKFERRPEYLHARIRSETMDQSMAHEYLAKVAEEVHSVKATKLMLERDVPVMLKDVDLFHTTQYFLNLIRGVRVAFVNPYIEIHDDMDFAVTIGTNRGANYRLFKGVVEAEAWLIGRVNPQSGSSPTLSNEAN